MSSQPSRSSEDRQEGVSKIMKRMKSALKKGSNRSSISSESSRAAEYVPPPSPFLSIPLSLASFVFSSLLLIVHQSYHHYCYHHHHHHSRWYFPCPCPCPDSGFCSHGYRYHYCSCSCPCSSYYYYHQHHHNHEEN